jgi:phosphoribosylanthranilate isomerase
LASRHHHHDTDMTRPRVKICCISSLAEAALAIHHGASALGLVGDMPSGPGIIDDDLIREIARTVPPPISTFLLTSETAVDSIVAHYRRANTSTLQLVDRLSHGQYHQLRDELPHVKLVQVVHVLDSRSVAEAVEVAEHVDAILLDSGNPHLLVKELGGTGRTHNWGLSREIKDRIRIPLFLAGGLNSENVRRAIDQVQPFGIDLCSSVRTNGQLDERKLEAFFRALE